MSDHKLVLHPTDPWASLANRAALIDELTTLGLLGEQYEWFGETHYKPGVEFLRLVEFDHSHTVIVMGDTPNGLQEVDRVDSREVCHLHLSDVSQEPEFRGVANTLPPLCPSCHYEPEEPFEIVGKWYENKASFLWVCPNCTASSALNKMNWRRSAGIARYTLDIWEVWQGEATPSEALLHHLNSITGTEWTYFYYHL
jgi:hypothetical protein